HVDCILDKQRQFKTLGQESGKINVRDARYVRGSQDCTGALLVDAGDRDNPHADVAPADAGARDHACDKGSYLIDNVDSTTAISLLHVFGDHIAVKRGDGDAKVDPAEIDAEH